MVDTDEALIEELTTRGIEEIYPSPYRLAEELGSGRQLRAYMGIDPTAPDMHIGHESQLLKLRRLQKLGHHIILLIGDFTAMIGDPSDKSAARVKLSRDEVLANAEGYQQQASKVIDFEDADNPAELRYNSEWLGAMSFADVLELASEFTVQQMLDRDMFQRRIADGKPVGLHEFLYPTMQGWDSVMLDVDIEVGGSDQIFNMLVGSTLLRRHTGKQKFVIAGKLLADPGGRKIGKTEGNMITLNDSPLDMFHKIMLWGDGITPHALELCTQLPLSEVREIEHKLKIGAMSGIEGKLFLARTIVSELHGRVAATEAEKQYQALASPEADLDNTDLPSIDVQPGRGIVQVLVETGLASSNNHARRLLSAGAVRINERPIDEAWVAPGSTDSLILRVGKRKLENHRKLNVILPGGTK
ncbi:tyrosine--tRNA ligase [Candidatus Microgenomates bacterium]|nr:tyrosine--tRNA ligase [Candidatus Microgenomates bacterium]